MVHRFFFLCACGSDGLILPLSQFLSSCLWPHCLSLFISPCKSYLSWHRTNSLNPRRTSHRNRRRLQKANRKPHRTVLPLLLLRGDLVGVTAVLVVLSSRVCIGFYFVVVVGLRLRLSWSDESVAIVWENRRLRENGTSDRWLLSHLNFGFWFWGEGEGFNFWVSENWVLISVFRRELGFVLQ